MSAFSDQSPSSPRKKRAAPEHTEDAAESSLDSVNETSDSPNSPTIQAPDAFYAEAVARPDVAEILRRLRR